MKERTNKMECSGGVYCHSISGGSCSIWVKSNYSVLPIMKMNAQELGFLEDEEIKLVLGEFTKFFGNTAKFISPAYKQALIIINEDNNAKYHILPHIDWTMVGSYPLLKAVYVLDYKVYHYLVSIFHRNVEPKHLEKIIPYPTGDKYFKKLQMLNPEDLFYRLTNNNKLDGLLVADTETEDIDVLSLDLCYLFSKNEEAQEELRRLKERYVPLFRYQRGDIFLGLLPENILTEEEYQLAFHDNMEWKNYIKKCLGDTKDEIARKEALKLFNSIWALILERSKEFIKSSEGWR